MYQLMNSGVWVGSAVMGTGAPIVFPVSSSGTYTVMAIDGTTGCTSMMAGSAVVTVSPLPTSYAVVGGGSYCAGGAGLPIGLSGTVTGIDYQLFNGSAAMSSPVAGTGSAISFGAMTAAGSYTVIATDPVSGCTNTMGSGATIMVNPVPNIYPVTGGGSYCSWQWRFHWP